jgi:hypothetical protein
MAKIMTSSTMMIAWQDQKLNSISEFQIPGVGGVSEAKLYFRVSDTESWKCQNTSSQECRNAEMQNTLKYQTVDLTPFQSFRYRELEVSKHFITEMLKNVETPKYRTVDLTPFRSFGYRELEVSKHFITEMSKRRNAKC